MPNPSTMIGEDPLPHGPLADVAIPSTLEDVCFQLEMLATASDHDYAHIEADRLLLLALAVTATANKPPTASEVADISTAYKNIRKHYA